MLLCLTISLLFVATSASPTGRTDVVIPSMETLRSDLKIIKFRALDQDIELRLQPAGEVLSDDFAIVNDRNEKEYSVDVQSLKKKIYRDKESGAALIIDEQGPLTIRGIVNANLRIQPYGSMKMTRDNTVAHRIIEVQDDSNPLIHDAIMPEKGGWKMGQREETTTEGECIVIEYLFVTEGNFTASFQNPDDLTEYFTLMVTGIQNLMDTIELGISVRMIGITPFQKGLEPSFILDSEIPGNKQYFDTGRIIENLGKYYCKNPDLEFVKQADVIMFITKRKMADPKPNGRVSISAVGIAYLGGVCSKCWKVGVTVDDANYNERVDTVAHESAHLIGSPHDGDGVKGSLPDSPTGKDCPSSDGYIMGNRRTNPFKFSPCTKANVEFLLNNNKGKCLKEDCSA